MTVDIADVDAALAKIRAFIALLEQHHAAWEQTSAYDSFSSPQLKEADNQIQEQLPLIVRIAGRADADLAAKMKKDGGAYGWSYYRIREASRQLAGLLSSIDETERILGPVGPKLAAANLHPWIWNAAVSLWDGGHRREAIQAAAQALLEQHLPAKLGIPPAKSAKDTVAQAFSTDPPAAGRPRLRLTDYPDGSPSWTSQNEGARYLGMGCAQLIRNLATHVGTQANEQIALEQLATMSLFARIIDQATLVTV
jgi:hypothetical protein